MSSRRVLVLVRALAVVCNAAAATLWFDEGHLTLGALNLFAAACFLTVLVLDADQ